MGSGYPSQKKEVSNMDFKEYLREEEKNLQCEEEEKGGEVRGTHVRRFKARSIRNLRQFRKSQGTHGTLNPNERSFIRQRVATQSAAVKEQDPK